MEPNRSNDLKSSNVIGEYTTTVQNPKSQGPTPRCAGSVHAAGHEAGAAEEEGARSAGQGRGGGAGHQPPGLRLRAQARLHRRRDAPAPQGTTTARDSSPPGPVTHWGVNDRKKPQIRHIVRARHGRTASAKSWRENRVLEGYNGLIRSEWSTLRCPCRALVGPGVVADSVADSIAARWREHQRERLLWGAAFSSRGVSVRVQVAASGSRGAVRGSSAGANHRERRFERRANADVRIGWRICTTRRRRNELRTNRLTHPLKRIVRMLSNPFDPEEEEEEEEEDMEMQAAGTQGTDEGDAARMSVSDDE
eukprot:7335890-Pyramimonas_sp.AAC.1